MLCLTLKSVGVNEGPPVAEQVTSTWSLEPELESGFDSNGDGEMDLWWWRERAVGANEVQQKPTSRNGIGRLVL